MNKKWLIGLAATTLLFGAGAGLTLGASSTGAVETKAGRPIHEQTISISAEATRLKWANSTAYTNWTDTSGLFTITADDGNANNGKYYTSDKTWRMYNGGSMTIAIADGYQIESITSNPSCTFAVAGNKLSATASFTATTRFTSFTIEYVDLSEPEETAFHVTYDGNGATSGSMSDDTDYEENDTVTILASGYTWEFHEITGWNTKADGTGTAYALNGTFTITKSVTLYAQWVIKDVDDLPNGSYSSGLSYDALAGAMPGSVALLSGENAVGLLGVSYVSVTDGGTFYSLANNKSGKITFTNHSNAKFTKVKLTVANEYDNFSITADGTSVHQGDGKNGHPTIEVDVDATDTIVVACNQTSYAARLAKVEFSMRVGDDDVHVTSVSLNAESGNVYVGQTRQLSATVLPFDADDQSVAWSSSDTNVATVDSNGLVAGVAVGTANITATTNDGGLTATFAANVKTLSYGTVAEPLTPEEAYEVLQITGTSVSASKLTVRGVVSESSYNSDDSTWTIWLKSSDGLTPKYFELYKATLGVTALDDFTTNNALVGFTLITEGYGKMYQGAPELSNDNSTNPSIKVISYSAEAFAIKVIAETGTVCADYVDESEYAARKAALETVWESLTAKYETLSAADADLVGSAEAKEDGTIVEQAMARYDYLAGKYELTNFITGRTPVAFARVSFGNAASGQTAMIVTVIAIVAVSTLAAGALVMIRRKKEN